MSWAPEKKFKKNLIIITCPFTHARESRFASVRVGVVGHWEQPRTHLFGRQTHGPASFHPVTASPRTSRRGVRRVVFNVATVVRGRPSVVHRPRSVRRPRPVRQYRCARPPRVRVLKNATSSIDFNYSLGFVISTMKSLSLQAQ